MKKSNLFLTVGFMICAVCGLSTPALSEDNIFGELTTTPPPATTDVQTQTVKVEQPIVVRGSSQMSKQESLTTQSLQTSISSLEAAQAELRTKLETAKSNYTAVNQEYARVKQERAALKKIVNKTNSRIKSLEKTKKKIQKTIQTDL